MTRKIYLIQPTYRDSIGRLLQGNVLFLVVVRFVLKPENRVVALRGDEIRVPMQQPKYKGKFDPGCRCK